MTDSSSTPDVAALVANALQLTEQRIQATPPGPMHDMLASVRNQLTFMRDTVAAGRTPTIQEKNSLTLHVIAVREFDDDREKTYREALTHSAYYFKKL